MSEIAQSCPTLCDPWTVAYQASPSIGFSRQGYWSGLPFPSPGDLPNPGIEPGSSALEADALTSEPPGKPNVSATAKSLQSCPTLCDPIDSSPPGSPISGILQAKNTEVVCHFLLQCVKVKSESEVAQSFPTLSNPMDCCLPGSSIHGIFQARVLEWGAIAFSDVSARIEQLSKYIWRMRASFSLWERSYK